MDVTRPETISFWSLDLRVRDPHPEEGEIPLDNDNVNQYIRLEHHRWEWQAPQLYDLEPSRKSSPPVLPTLEATFQPTPISLSLVGDEDVCVRGDRIILRNSGLAAVIDQGESQRVLTEPVDGTENVSLTATVGGIVHMEQERAVGYLDDRIRLPVAGYQPFERAGATKQLGGFDSIQPIFYLQQDVGFVLLAEAFQSPEERRLIYTLRPVTEMEPVGESNGSISSAQVKATTPAFRLADDGAMHTIRAHQDGNLSNRRGVHNGYLEFWVNGLPLGVRRLPDARFRFRGGPAQLYIGAWPRGKDSKSWLYMTGEIVHINFDPINKCTPC
jgi:hypothetical protein